ASRGVGAGGVFGAGIQVRVGAFVDVCAGLPVALIAGVTLAGAASGGVGAGGVFVAGVQAWVGAFVDVRAGFAVAVKARVALTGIVSRGVGARGVGVTGVGAARALIDIDARPMGVELIAGVAIAVIGTR